MNERQQIGRWGEEIAMRYLQEKGYQFVRKNIYTDYGEIDLLMKQGDEYVFVEVRTKTSMEFGFPEESVNLKKQTHMVKSAIDYSQKNLPEDATWRIDVVAVWKTCKGCETEIYHLEDAVRD